ncbi:MAG: hypothetical protein ACI8WT_001393 [Clostridium sp.]|jgi:hypothetical protein
MSSSKFSDPKVLIAMGMQDDVLDVSCNDEFIDEGLSHGWNIVKLIHSFGEHGFDAFDEGEETNQIIRRTIDFLSDEH